MEFPDSLTTVAEIAVALAGFSGLVVVLRKSSGPLSRIEKYRMAVLLATAFGAMFLALLPGILWHFGFIEGVIWRVSGAALAAYTMIFITGWIVSSRRFFREVREIFNMTAFTLMAAGHAVNVLLQITIAIGLMAERRTGIYLLGLVWLLAHASQQFMRMLFVQPRVGDNA